MPALDKNIPIGIMKFPNRQSIRLAGYDYSSKGAYFVTICTNNRSCLFGKIMDGTMLLNDAGRMVESVWNEIPLFYPNIATDKFMIMPNHFHAIVKINNPVGAGPCACPNVEKPRNEIRGQCVTNSTSHNHVTEGQPQGVAPTTKPLSLPDVVHRFKTMTTKRYTDGVRNQNWPLFSQKLWQRNYWEHIIRNHDEYNRIADYINSNPEKWENDQLNIDNGNMIREKQSIYGLEEWMV